MTHGVVPPVLKASHGMLKDPIGYHAVVIFNGLLNEAIVVFRQSEQASQIQNQYNDSHPRTAKFTGVQRTIDVHETGDEAANAENEE